MLSSAAAGSIHSSALGFFAAEWRRPRPCREGFYAARVPGVRVAFGFKKYCDTAALDWYVGG